MKNTINKIICFAVFATTMLSSAISAEEEMKTFGEWVKVYEQEQEAAYKAHPELKNIEKGAAFRLTAMGVNPSLKKIFDKREIYTPIGLEQRDAYDAFVKSEKCKSLLATWEKDGKLAAKNSAYQWLIYAIHSKSAHFSVKKDKKVAKTISTIYTNKKVSRAEMDAVRYKLAQMGQCKGWTSGTLMPMPRGIGAWGQYIDLKKYYPNIMGIEAGATVPNLTLKRFDLNAEIKEVEFQSSLEAFITVEGVQALYDYVISSLSDGKSSQHDFDLYKEIEKGKPIFFLSHATQNTFDYIFDLAAKHALYDLFKDDVSFFHHTYDVRWDHDYGSACEIYLPEIWKNRPLKKHLPYSGYQYKIQEANWDAEIRDWAFMRFPLLL